MKISVDACCALLAGALLLGSGLAASADQPGGIVVRYGRIFETNQAGMQTQGFIEIQNSQPVADTLTAVECSIAGSTSLVGPRGAPVNSLSVAPGKILVLAANGPHILLQSTHFAIDQGGAIPCSLIFQNAGEISVYLYPIPAP
jgi:copper(I)-binding protein